MDPETPRNTRYNLRERKAKPEPRQGTSGQVLARYTRKESPQDSKLLRPKVKAKGPFAEEPLRKQKKGCCHPALGVVVTNVRKKEW